MQDQLPRRAYFAAADRAPLEGAATSPARSTAQAATATTRQQLAQTLIAKAEAVAGAVKTVRAFDGTGSILDAMPHLEVTVQDLRAAHTAFVADVARFVDRTDRRERPAGTGPAFPLDQRIGLGAAFVSVDVNKAGDALEASIGRHPAGSALAEADAAEAAAAGEPPLPPQLSGPYTHPSMPTPKPGPDAYRVHRNYPA